MFNLFKASKPFESAFSSAEEVAAMPIFSSQQAEGLDISLLFPGKNRTIKYLGNGPVGVIGPTRSGKGVMIFVPICMTWEGPVIAFDMKGELLEICGKSRKEKGPTYAVWKSWRDDSRSEEKFPIIRFNLFDTIRWGTEDEESDIHLLCSSLTRRKQHGIIDEMATMLIGAVAKHLHETGSKVTGASVGLALWSSNSGSEEWFMKRHKEENLMDIPWWREDLFPKARAHANDCMKIFQDVRVSELTSTTDFPIETWQDDNVTLFFPTSPNIYHEYDHLLRAAFDTLTNRKSKNKRKTVILMPERLTLGLIKIEEDAEAFAAEGKILVASFQSLEMMNDVYSKKSGFENACDVIFVLGSYDKKTNDWVSKKIGITTIQMIGKNQEKKFLERPIIAPNEVEQFIHSENKVIVLVKYRKPFLANKMPYYQRRDLGF